MNLQHATEALQIADAMSAPICEGDSPVLAVRVAHGTRMVSVERFRERPTFMQRSVNFLAAEEFVAYCQRFESMSSAGFAEIRPLRIRQLFDYGSTEEPGWAMHRAEFTPQHSPAFRAWDQMHKRPMSHRDFADFMEERSIDVVAPSSAVMLEMATGFEAAGTVQFSSGVRLQSGDVKLQFTTETRGSARGGEMAIPSQFQIMVPVYEFAPFVELTARLRYRIKEGALSIWYEFQRLDDVLGKYDMDVLGSIRSGVARIALGSMVWNLGPAEA